MQARTLIWLFALFAGASARAEVAPDSAGTLGSLGTLVIPGLSVSGFGTLGVVRSNTDAAQFVRYNQQSGARRHLDASVDSILGMQASYRASAAFSATAQALLRENIDGDYRPSLAWAFLRYQASDALAVRVGRLAAPGYLQADSLNIGYLTTAMRPTPEVYGISQLTHIEGADLIWQRDIGTYTLSTQLVAGYDRTRIATDTAGRALLDIGTHITGLSLTLEHGALLLRAAHIRADVAVPDLPGLPQLWQALAGAGYAQLGPRLSLRDGKRFSFNSVGMTFDQDRLTLQAEYVTRRSRQSSYVADTAAWYALAGYRFGAWLPYYQHAGLRQTGSAVRLPAGFPASGALAEAVRDLTTAPAQHSDTLGLRWNVAPGRALTVQLDRLHPTAKSGVLIRGPAAGLRQPVMLLGIALDFVY